MRDRRILTITVILLTAAVAAVLLTRLIAVPAPPRMSVEFAAGHAIDVYDADTQSTVTMELEDYVYHVVAAEMPASYETEALKAQAVCARTYAVWKQRHKGCSGADVCTSSAHCQAYRSDAELAKRWGDSYEKYRDKLQSCVAATAGQILTYDSEVISVMYHSSSGGPTEAAKNVYGNELPYLVSVASDGEDGVDAETLTVSKSEFAETINELEPGTVTGGIEIGDAVRNESGRVASVIINGRAFTGVQLRRAFSLKSTRFTVRVSDDVTFQTTGFGHGIGMSQVGAGLMAKSGSDYMQILAHYFSGTRVCPL